MSRLLAAVRRRRHDESGFTLVEQLVVMGVLGIVLTIVFQFLITATATTTRADANVRAETNAIDALRTVTEDLRSASTVSECAGLSLAECVTVDISKVTSGTLSCPKRVVTYRVVSGELRQILADYADNCTTVTKSGTRVLISGVQSTSLFTYYGADGITALNPALTADKNKIIISGENKAIKVALSVQYRKNVPPLNLSSFASLRNR